MGSVPSAPEPEWAFELLRPGCVHQTLFIIKAVFLVLDSISVLCLLLLAGRLLRHRWRAQRRREERWAALQQQQSGQGNGRDEGGGSKGTARVAARWMRRWWGVVVGCGGCWAQEGAGPTTRVTIGDLFERLVSRG